jgi:hypothetical protein
MDRFSEAHMDDGTHSTEAEGSAIDDETGLPNVAGWMAVLRMEERRAWRHGGDHALGIVVVKPAVGPAALWAADTLVSALRETDVVALVAPGTFAVLALHCEAPETVEGRIRKMLGEAPAPLEAEVRVEAAGGSLVATWQQLVGRRKVGEAGPTPEPGLRDFVAVRKPCLN